MKLEVKLTARKIDLQEGLLVFDTPEALKQQITLLQDALNDREQRLEYFDDGIYFDGERLALTTKHESILRCFECMDKVPAIDLIYKVWGNGMTLQSTVASTINHLNKKIQDTGIFIERDGEFYKIVKEI